jgi:hypothetical protein
LALAFLLLVQPAILFGLLTQSVAIAAQVWVPTLLSSQAGSTVNARATLLGLIATGFYGRISTDLVEV